MEKETKTIGITTLITMGLIMMSMITPTFFVEDNQYYCESRGLIQECNSLSGGTGTRCYINEEASSWLFCREGWIKIDNDIQETEKEPEQIEVITPTPTQKAGVWGNQYTCDNNGCVEVVKVI